MHGNNSALTRHAVKALDREDVPNAEKILHCYIQSKSRWSNDVLWLSFWNTREDAERYDREQYPKINEMLSQHHANP